MNPVLVIARVFPPQVGGSGRFLSEVYYRQKGMDLCIAAGRCEGADAYDRTAPVPIERYRLHFHNWGLFPFGVGTYSTTFLRLAKLARRRRVTAVHAATLLPEGFLAWMLNRTLGLPYLCFIHGEELGYTRASREMSWMASRVLEGASRVIANSANTRELIIQTWPQCAEKIAVVTPGVDAAKFVPAARDFKVRERLGWVGRRVVLTVGRLQERKGHDRLIDALPAIRRSIPDVLLAIVGEGERRHMLESLVHARGVDDCVQFLGALGDQPLIECFQQCDVMALPNREIHGDIEGFGMVLVEAQACGRPVLAGMSGGTAETMQPGTTGRLVDCAGKDGLTRELIDMLRSPELLDQMGAAARTWAAEQFDWSVIAKRAGDVFQSVAPRRSRKSRAAAPLELELEQR